MKRGENYRDPVTGQYDFDGDWDRVCVCGHRLGSHIAGGHECIVHDCEPGAAECACPRFRQKRIKGRPVRLAAEVRS